MTPLACHGKAIQGQLCAHRLAGLGCASVPDKEREQDIHEVFAILVRPHFASGHVPMPALHLRLGAVPACCGRRPFSRQKAWSSQCIFSYLGFQASIAASASVASPQLLQRPIEEVSADGGFEAQAVEQVRSVPSPSKFPSQLPAAALPNQGAGP